MPDVTFRRDYLLRLPLPLAQLYARSHNAKDARSRHDNAFYLFEALIKLTCVPAVACYLHEAEQGRPRVAELDRQLTCLALPSLGQWLGLLRELAQQFGTRPDAASHPLGGLWDRLSRPRRDLPALLTLYRRIKNGPDGQAAGDQSCSLLEVFDALVRYRNGVFGHGGPRFEEFYERDMGPLLPSAAADVLGDGVLEPLGPAGSRLVSLAEVRVRDDGRVEVGLRELVGLQGERAAPLSLTPELAAGLAPGRTAVLWPGRTAPLPLHPLLLYREHELSDEVLFLNRDRDGRQVEYLSYATGRTERDRATAVALAELLGRVTGGAVGEEQLRSLADASRAGDSPSDGAESAPPGVVWGEYEILGELGRGGMGVVYLARQRSLGRLVALKTLPADLAGDAAALARFQREVRALARCDHPNIVKILSTGALPDGQIYYTMEYVPGCDLEQVWRELSGSAARPGGATWTAALRSASRKKHEQTTRRPADTRVAAAEGATAPPFSPPLPEPPCLPDEPSAYVREAARLVRDAARALQAVHDQGLIHRDVKPSNLMLTADGSRVVLMDFGLAKGDATTLAASRAAGFVGTLRYAAPEQLAAATLTVGPAADVRGLGVTLWELLTRRRLFAEAQDEKQLAALVHDKDVPRLRSIDRGFDRDLEAITARATERRSADRIGTAERLADYLDLYLQGKPLPIRPPGARELAWRWLMRRKAAVAATAAVLAAAALGSVLLWSLLAQGWAVERGVASDLKELAALRDQSRFGEARAVLKRAEDRLAGGGSAELASRVARARKDVEMAANLEEAPLLATQVVAGGYDTAAEVERYRKLFRDYDIDLEVLEPAEAAARIRATEIHERLIVALDYWAVCLPDEDRNLFGRLVNAADQADGIDWRKELRQAWSRGDRQALEGQLDRFDASSLPTTTVIVVSKRLLRLGGSDSRCAQILRTAQHAHPDDFWINHDLYELLADAPAHREEALGFLRAALAVKPDSPGAHYNVGVVLGHQDKWEEAEKEFRRAILLKDDFAEAHANLGVVVDDQGKREEAEKEYRRALQIKPDDSEMHVMLGVLVANLGRREEAEKEYRRALQLKDDDPKAHNYLGVVLADQGRRDEAEKEYRRAIQIKDSYAEAHSNLGLVLRRQGRRDEAEKEYRRAIQIKDDYAEAHNHLGVVLDDQGRRDEAEKEYRRAIQIKDDYPKAHYNLGLLLANRGNWKEAENEYRRALQLKDDDSEVHNSLGVVLDDQGRRDEAEKEYRRAIQIKDDDPMAHYNLGLLLADQGKGDEAEKEYRRAIQLKDDHPNSHYHLGLLLAGKGKGEEAEKEYRRAIQLKDDYAEAHNHLGVVLADQGKGDEAVKEYRRAIQIKDDYPQAHINLAQALRRQGEWDEAETEFRRALQLNDDDPRAHNDLGLVLRRQGNRDEAEKEYRRAIQLKDDYSEAHNNLGVVLADQGQRDEAEKEYRHAIQIKDDFPLAHNNLGVLLAGQGRRDEAEKEFRRAIELKSDFASAHWDLGRILKQEGRFGEAIPSLQRALELLPPTDARRPQAEKVLSQCQRLLELDGKLAAVLNGEVQAKAAEKIEYADLCERYRARYAVAARLYAEAFAQQPALADDLEAASCYNAACAAALAGIGKGEDGAGLDDQARTRLRNQALDWLRADLQAWDKRQQEEARARPKTQQALQRWQSDADLAGVRDKDALDKLPEDERLAWRKLWSDVDALLKRTQADAPPTPKP